MVQQVNTFVHVEFCPTKLKACFPSYRDEGADEKNLESVWYKGNVERAHPGLLAIMGTKMRQPGRICCVGAQITGVQIHIGARLRNHGALETDDAVPGYKLMAPVEDSLFWAHPQGSPRKTRICTNPNWLRHSTSSSSNSPSSRSVPEPAALEASASIPKDAFRIDEAPVGALEARCLGLPLSVVRG